MYKISIYISRKSLLNNWPKHQPDFFFVRSEEDRPTFRFLAQELADVLMELKNNNGHRDEHL